MPNRMKALLDGATAGLASFRSSIFNRPIRWVSGIIASAVVAWASGVLADATKSYLPTIQKISCLLNEKKPHPNGARFSVLVTALVDDLDLTVTQEIVKALWQAPDFDVFELCSPAVTDRFLPRDEAVKQSKQVVAKYGIDLVVWGDYDSKHDTARLYATNETGGCDYQRAPFSIGEVTKKPNFALSVTQDVVAVSLGQVLAACNASSFNEWDALSSRLPKFKTVIESIPNDLIKTERWSELLRRFSEANLMLSRHNGPDKMLLQAAEKYALRYEANLKDNEDQSKNYDGIQEDLMMIDHDLSTVTHNEHDDISQERYFNDLIIRSDRVFRHLTQQQKVVTWLSNPQAALNPKPDDLWRPSRALISWLYSIAINGSVDANLFSERLFMAQPDFAQKSDQRTLGAAMIWVIIHYESVTEVDPLVLSRAMSILQRIVDLNPDAPDDIFQECRRYITRGQDILDVLR